MKCKMCGKEITRTDKRCYCSVACYNKANQIKNKIKTMFKTVSRNYCFSITENRDKIANAKFLLFKNSDIKRCPCDANNSRRYCGSALCIYETIKHGHCHCNLFYINEKDFTNEK